MICQFTINGEPCYIAATSIVGVLPDYQRKGRSIVYCEGELSAVAIDEAVEDAYSEWFDTLYDEGTDDEYEDEGLSPYMFGVLDGEDETDVFGITLDYCGTEDDQCEDS